MNRNYRLFVVDDEPANLESLERVFRSDGAEVFTFEDPQKALSALRSSPPEVLLTDLRMNNWSGMDLLEAIKLFDPSIEVILMTAYGTVELAVEAMKKGADDFITKPLQRVQVLRAIHRALEKRRLVSENQSLKEELNAHMNGVPLDVIGRSESVRQMLDIARQTARSRASVLIEGESGTGKGLLAEFIHRESEQAKEVFVKVNCAAIPENLLEAELFGYEPGAFTGATKRKKGRVEVAHGGTLFLDEIGITPISFQAKLLRFLQDGEFERLGSNDTLKVNARVISATNADLRTGIQKGWFREDLYYRLNVVGLRVPPLRERHDDVPLLIARFVEESAKRNGRTAPTIDADAIDCMTHYSWPGNIRELQNLIERLIVLDHTGRIRRENLPIEIGGVNRVRHVTIPVGMPLREVEQILFEETLKTTRGDKRLTAKLLGVHPRTIYRYLEKSEEEADCPSV